MGAHVSAALAFLERPCWAKAGAPCRACICPYDRPATPPKQQHLDVDRQLGRAAAAAGAALQDRLQRLRACGMKWKGDWQQGRAKAGDA